MYEYCSEGYICPNLSMNLLEHMRLRIEELTHRESKCSATTIFMILIVFVITALMYEYNFNYEESFQYSMNQIRNYTTHEYQDAQFQENSTENYVVWSPLCRIPRIDPYHKSIKKYLFKWTPLICSKKNPLTFVQFNSTSRRHVLIVNKTEIHSYSPSLSELSCRYSVITRNFLKYQLTISDDSRYNLSEPVYFREEVEIPANVESIYVVCTAGKKQVYKTVHYMVIDKTNETVNLKRKKPRHNFSILLFGIDSISRLNFIRTLPKTREFVERRGWIELEGYNKIADNTFPNLMAVLTGMHVEQLVNICYDSWTDEMDDCPFIWKSFQKETFLTAYIEDSASMGTFNYAKYGFLNSPTDYYSRPLMKAAADLLPTKDNGDVTYCIGQYPQIEYLFQYMTEFVQRFHNRRYFNLFWANSFSHSALNMPSVMDDRVKQFLESIDGYLNSTVVIFFSDHGMRFGSIRKSFVGWLEERMPFLYFHLPPSFKRAYPRRYENLLANKNRLTSPFDLYATLLEFLHGRVHRPILGCPKCDSLFAPVAYNRSCNDAGISSEWCTCSVAQNLESVSDLKITAAVHLAIIRINKFLRMNKDKLNEGFKCASLSLSKIISVRSKIRNEGSTMSQKEFIIVFQTKPSEAVLEITLPENVTEAINEKKISRIDKYGEQSSCVKGEAKMKLFCFCEKN